MDTDSLMIKAMESIRFVNAGSLEPVKNPDTPLWPGIYRKEIDRTSVTWHPLKLDEWRQLTPKNRLDILLEQMRQITSARDSHGVIEVDVEKEAVAAGLTAAEFRQGIHKSLCRVYGEFKKRRTAISALSNLANALLLAVFGVDTPIANYSDEAAISIIAVYGEKYCGKAEERSEPQV